MRTPHDAFPPLATRAIRETREREILRVAASVGGKDPVAGASKAKREILIWAEKRTGGRLNAAAWKYDEFEHLAGGRNCRAVRISDDTRETWAIRSDDPDKEVPRRVWTMEAFVASGPGHRPLFGLRLLVTSPEPELLIEPAVPGVIQQLARKCGLHGGHGELDSRPWTIRTEAHAAKLIDILLHPKRRIPVFVLSLPERSGGSAEPLIDAEYVAIKSLGMAVTMVIPAHFTWVLTERFGKQLSVYNGAVRVYLPGFAEDADPYEHELILTDRIGTGPDGARRIASRLQHIAAAESLRQCRVGRDVLSFADVREKSDDYRLARLREEHASEAVQLRVAQQQIDTLKADLRTSEESSLFFVEEHSRVENRAKAAESEAQWLNYRVQQLKHQLEARNESPDSNIRLPTAWSDFADWCDENFAPRVALSARARRGVKDAKYDDVEAAARCLRWLANDYHDQRRGGGEGDLRVSIEEGIPNDRCGADAFLFKWKDQNREVNWHIKSGGNTRDPRRCLRIYYFWDEIKRQVIVVSMPAHIRTAAT